MPLSPHTIKGLTEEQVVSSRARYGPNILNFKKQGRLAGVLKSIFGEPMVILLLAAAAIYLFSGQSADALLLFSAIIIISVISLYQEGKSRNALAKLQELTQPRCKVIRNGTETGIKTEELVPGDCLIIEEGETIPADGVILHANDFTVNESVITGETFPVPKNEHSEDKNIFSGTTVATGLAIVEVTNTGNRTKLGSIGHSMQEMTEEKTPLEIQIANFVRYMAIAGTVIFLLVWAINYFNSGSVLKSLLKALTLAMSILPEEIPVAFTTFMALGAWRLMKSGIVVRQMKTVEALGSATVICVDKTGTITQNKMSLARLYLPEAGTLVIVSDISHLEKEAQELLRIAMFASEPVPFDPMEKALHEAYGATAATDERPQYELVHEYPLEGRPPMMTHVFENAEGKRIIAAKGAPEAILAFSGLSHTGMESAKQAIAALASEGYRVLAVGQAQSEVLPLAQQELRFDFKGLVAFYDPPKPNIATVLKDFYNAGIEVKIITGDNSLTTASIAREIGFRGYEKSMTGEELMQLSDAELVTVVRDINIFSRMFPEAKLWIINALKANNQVVAMTGDGVNDGPALKAAHIGIAMGKKGTAIAKNASSLVLVEDDLSKMVEAVAMGRKIYANLKKAVQYIISIHIPIILIVFIPLLLGWVYPSVFSPVHVILLELIMGPTCSIAFENDPLEKNAMLAKPRPFTTSFFSWRELGRSILQGLVITGGLVLVYQLSVAKGYTEDLTRTLVFTTLVISNILLTEVNRSAVYSIFTVAGYKNALVGYILAATLGILVVSLTVPPVSDLFNFTGITSLQLLLCIGVAAVTVLWYEAVKYYRRRG